MKKLYLSIAACIILTGCAARVFTVTLSPPTAPSSGFFDKLDVADNRPDPQIYMTSISYASKVNVYSLDSEPSLNVALQEFIESRTSMQEPSSLPHSLEVSIERLDIKNKVGFAKADDLRCEIESRISWLSESVNHTEKVVTFSKNTENMSPFVTTTTRVILQQCLNKHAEDILKKAIR